MEKKTSDDLCSYSRKSEICSSLYQWQQNEKKVHSIMKYRTVNISQITLHQMYKEPNSLKLVSSISEDSWIASEQYPKMTSEKYKKDSEHCYSKSRLYPPFLEGSRGTFVNTVYHFTSWSQKNHFI
jgi:hypothetical protein